MTIDKEQIAQTFIEGIPQARELGLRLLAAGDGVAEITMPWAGGLAGDRGRG